MVIVICGPTGSGKSALAMKLASEINGEIISGDAFQVYKELDIGTSKPSLEDRKLIRHYLYDFLAPDMSYDIFLYQVDVRMAIEEVVNKGKTPIIVGGSALYIRAGLYDYTFEKEEHFDAHKYDKYTNAELHKMLEEIDLEESKKIHENNRKRVVRALTIYDSTGKTKSEIIDSQEHKLLYDTLFIGLDFSRDDLYQRINKRVDKMIADGLVGEATRVMKKYGSNASALQAIGYKEIVKMNKEHISLEETIEDIKKHSRNYAKRQMTFFRNKFNVNWFNKPEDAYEFCLKELKK